MGLGKLAIAALLGWVVATSARAETYESAPKTSVGFIRTADRFWSGAVELAPCARPDVRRHRFALITPRFLTASQERRGELIGEILSPPPLARLVAAKARDCASAAGESPVLLTQGPAAFSRFRGAFSACMAEQDAAQYVGSMTLWIDNHCNW
ncbi:MAG: hypothetical protein ABW360_17215 [Phenylobacterium sp.]